MKIAVSGSSGLVGSALVSALRARGDRVVRLVRHAARGEDEQVWDPDSGLADPARLEGLDAVVHLAGENIGAKRWTDAQKRRIRESRARGTATLVRDLAELGAPPRAFVGASAIGFYGSTGDRAVDETDGPGEGFLPEVCRAWEDASHPLAARGVRVVHARFGMILSPDGGALLHALDRSELSGPVNVVAPGACSNRAFTKALGRALHRPTVFPLPAFAARLAFGELADELLLGSSWVRSRVLAESGFRFQDPEIDGALQGLVGRAAA
jgi:hypothetical protein